MVKHPKYIQFVINVMLELHLNYNDMKLEFE